MMSVGVLGSWVVVILIRLVMCGLKLDVIVNVFFMCLVCGFGMISIVLGLFVWCLILIC